MGGCATRGLTGRLENMDCFLCSSAGGDNIPRPISLPSGATELIPLWVAPNLITLAGMLGLILSYFLFLFYLPTLEGERWRDTRFHTAGREIS